MPNNLQLLLSNIILREGFYYFCNHQKTIYHCIVRTIKMHPWMYTFLVEPSKILTKQWSIEKGNPTKLVPIARAELEE